ncbi:hypothetical protein [Natronomonas marina]|jgi:hypothetical protein|uniref:hypothetical protein n=1 Tax=Natronomonas marina TaxID=2961939 RepID=UPI0020C95EC2|nr:hypothetical protein [Natronomonas marina]
MTLRRLAAVVGFCFMLVSVTLVLHLFVLAWLVGSDQVTVHMNALGERDVELGLMFVGFCLVPITIYELDVLLREAE